VNLAVATCTYLSDVDGIFLISDRPFAVFHIELPHSRTLCDNEIKKLVCRVSCLVNVCSQRGLENGE
jgi:hypothetical protein